MGDTVSFVDGDGDTVLLELVAQGRVDYSVNGALRIKDAVLRRRGGAIELTGQDVSSWLFKLSGGAINEEIREATTPPDEADVERALVLAGRK